jgi:hypothetical protein
MVVPIVDPGGYLVRAIVENYRGCLDLIDQFEGARVERERGYVRWTSAIRIPLFRKPVRPRIRDGCRGRQCWPRSMVDITCLPGSEDHPIGTGLSRCPPHIVTERRRAGRDGSSTCGG